MRAEDPLSNVAQHGREQGMPLFAITIKFLSTSDFFHDCNYAPGRCTAWELGDCTMLIGDG
jgi:hypothetical protein